MEERKPLYGIGDLIKIVNYGHLTYYNKKGFKEMDESFEKLSAKSFIKAFFDREATEDELSKIKGRDKPNNIVSEDESMWACDMSPEIVGREDIVDEVTVTQGIPSYSLRDYGAWYHENQMELVNKNPNSI